MEKSNPNSTTSALLELQPWFDRPLHPSKGVASKERENARQIPYSISDLGLPPAGNKKPLEFAVSLLRAGAEIEHALLVQYLYAAYSIDEAAPQDASDRALLWKTHIRLIAREEMAHLVTVQNVLLALKQPFHLNRGDVHGGPDSQVLPFMLEPLSLRSLAKYVILESPWDDQMNTKTRNLMNKVRATVDEPVHGRLLRVGLIYAALYWVFLENDNPGSDWPFPRAWVQEFQQTYSQDFHIKAHFNDTSAYNDLAATAAEWGIYEVNAHADAGNPREEALRALRWIMAQGEGPNAIEKSHFFRFLNMFAEFDGLGTSTARMIFNVPTNPVTGDGPFKPGTIPIVNSESAHLAALLNVRYQLLLLDTLQSLSSSRKDDPVARTRYAEWAIMEMEFIRRIAELLPHRPLGSRVDGKEGRAAAPFQMDDLIFVEKNRVGLRNVLVERSADLIANFKDRRNISGAPPLSFEHSLMEAIAIHDDHMRRLY